MRRLLARALNLLHWRRLERELEDEISSHVEHATEHHMATGMDARRAKQASLRALGPVDAWKEASRDTRGFRPLQDAGRDLRYAIRTLGRSPGFAFATILVLALGIGGATAVYSVIRSVLLRPLPYENPEELHMLWESNGPDAFRSLSYAAFVDLRAALGTRMPMAFVRASAVIARDSAGARNLIGAFVTPNLFTLLGRNVAAGRAFDANDGSEPVAVLSWRLAHLLYGGAAQSIGRTIATPDASYAVIGVLPDDVGFPEWADLWLPLDALPADMMFVLQQRTLHVDTRTLVRVPADMTGRAQLELDAALERLTRQYPEPGIPYDSAYLVPLQQSLTQNNAASLYALFGAVVLVLLIACVNVTGLLLARAHARRRELAVRLALGATRGRLLRQLLAESLLPGVMGGALGVSIAALSVRWFRLATPVVLPRMDQIGLDLSTLLFALGITLGSVLLTGLLPAVRAVPSRGMATRSDAGGRLGQSARLRSVLVVAQVALAAVLVVGASLFIRSGIALSRQEPGFEPDGLIALRVVPSGENKSPEAALSLYERIRAAAGRVPGVAGAELVNHIPLGGPFVPTDVVTARAVPADETPTAIFRVSSPGYLDLIGARLNAGRMLGPEDASGPGVVVNRALAEREWPGADPIGESITVYHAAQGRESLGKPMPSMVVGVIEDMYEFGPENDPVPTVYVSDQRDPWPNIFLVVRAATDPAALMEPLRRAIAGIEPDVPVAGPGFNQEFHTLDEYEQRWTQQRTFTTGLLSGFAGAALLLAAIGLFAVMAYVVNQRTAEIGVRMALGARPAQIASLVLGQAGKLVGAGLFIGLVAALFASRLVENQLRHVERFDPVSYGIAGGLFLGAALLAAYLPAHRAARTDPLRALR